MVEALVSLGEFGGSDHGGGGFWQQEVALWIIYDVVFVWNVMYVDINLALTWSPRDALSSQEGWLKINDGEVMNDYDGGEWW